MMPPTNELEPERVKIALRRTDREALKFAAISSIPAAAVGIMLVALDAFWPLVLIAILLTGKLSTRIMLRRLQAKCDRKPSDTRNQ